MIFTPHVAEYLGVTHGHKLCIMLIYLYYIYVIVISWYECDIIVITRVRGAAEDEC